MNDFANAADFLAAIAKGYDADILQVVNGEVVTYLGERDLGEHEFHVVKTCEKIIVKRDPAESKPSFDVWDAERRAAK